MESNAPCLVLPNNADNYTNLLSTGYLEDALLEISVRFKRRKLMVCSPNDHFQEVHDDHLASNNHFTDDLSYWNNWLSNYSISSDSSEEQLSHDHASLLADHDHMHMHYSSGDTMEKSMTEIMCDDLMYHPETNTFLLDDIIAANSPMPPESLSRSKDNSFNTNDSTHSTALAYRSTDTYSTESSSISGDTELKKKKKVNITDSNTAKMVFPFGLVKPGFEDGDVTLNDINKRILRPPSRALKHPVGQFACRPAVSPNGPGLSGKAVVALTRIHTQGRGTITIIRTKG